VHVVSDMLGFEGCRNQEVAVSLMEGDNSAGVDPSSADASRDRDNLVSSALPCLALFSIAVYPLDEANVEFTRTQPLRTYNSSQ
jgi:hypothetical protein